MLFWLNFCNLFGAWKIVGMIMTCTILFQILLFFYLLVTAMIVPTIFFRNHASNTAISVSSGVVPFYFL